MLTLKADSPIGIFDSGIGGLTVAKAVVDRLPNETIIYFGDTAHLPYGDKSISTIKGYAKRIVDFLLEKRVKLILIACNSASAAAYEMLREYIGTKALLLNVVDPLVSYLNKNYDDKCVGLIGTKLTVQSEIYGKKLTELDANIRLRSLATPLLVPIIEEGFAEHPLIDVALSEYLSQPQLNNIEALVLGCTHYPVIKKSIASYYQDKIKIIDAAKIIADEVNAKLQAHNLFSTQPPERHFYVSDYTASFVKRTKIFFGEEINVEALNIF